MKINNLILMFLAVFPVCFGQVAGPAIDPRKVARFDDGSAEGAIRARIVKGDLIPLPISEFGYTGADTAGGSTMTLLKGSGGVQGGITYNSDGSGVTLQIIAATQPAGTASGIRVLFNFYGPAIGVRLTRTYNGNTNSFSALVDGVAYEVPNTLRRIYTGDAVLSAPPTEDYDTFILLTDNLPDPPNGNPHWLELWFPNPYTGSAYQWQIHGLLVSKLGGYERLPRVQSYVDAVVLTTGFLGVQKAGGTNPLKSISEINYYNTTAGTVVVTLRQNDLDFAVITLTAAGTVNSQASVILPLNGVAFNRADSGAGSLTHKCDTGAAVNFTVFGSQ